MTTPDPRNDDFTEDVRAALGARMDHMDVGQGDLDGVVTRARRGRAVTRIAAAAAVVVVLAGGGALAMQLARGQVDPPDVAAPTLTPTPAPATTDPTATGTPVPGPTSDPSGTATAPAAAPTPTPARTPVAPTADPTSDPPGPTTPTVEQVMRTLLTTPGNLVSATADGIDVIEPDGTVHDVPGVEGPVEMAFADGSGGVVFQRNDVGIGRLVDGDVRTIIALESFGERSVTVTDLRAKAPEPTPRTIAPAVLQLEDVDATSDRIAFWVRWRGDQPFYDAHQGDFTAEFDGGGRAQQNFRFIWESGSTRDMVGEATVTVAGGEGGYLARWARGDQQVQLGPPDPTVSGATVTSAALADDATTVALARAGQDGRVVDVVDAPSNDVVTSWPAPTSGAVVDVDANAVALCSCEWDWVAVAAEGSITTVHDRATGDEVRRVDGRATFVR